MTELAHSHSEHSQPIVRDHSHALIDLRDVVVNGVDTQARAGTLRALFTRKGRLIDTRIPILRGVTFKAVPGDRVGILGLNGAGKSSLMKVISGNYPIHAGYRNVQGTIVPLIEMGAGFDGELTGRRNIKLTYAYRGRLHEYSPEAEEAIIAFSELGDAIDHPLKIYSTGMVARLAFSTCIFQQPDILLLDEVFATGDAGFIEKSKQFVKKRWDEAALGLFVGHQLSDITDLCNRAILLAKGQVIAEGKVDEVVREYQSIISGKTIHVGSAA